MKKTPYAGAPKTKRKGRPKATKRKPDIATAFLPPTGNKAFDDRIAPKRAAAIERIIKAVGKEPDDKNQLALDINEADTTYAILYKLDGAKAAKRLQRVKRARKGIEKYVVLLKDEPLLWEAINEAASFADMSLLDPVRQFENSQARIVAEYRSKTNLPSSLKGRRPTSAEWLAGVSLPLVYEKRFNSPNAAGGPLIDFVAAAMEQLGVNYNRAAITKAITRLRPVRDNCRK